MEFIQMNTFSNLLKLEVLDLSNNKIYLIKDNSFNGLINLRDLYINGNEPYLKIENSSFNQFETIRTIFLDKSILNNSFHKILFIDMIKKKNFIHNKTIIVWSYFKAFNLITLNEPFYDCGLVFELIRFNIQYNLKTESDFSDNLYNCEFNTIERNFSNSYMIQEKKITINYFFLYLGMLSYSFVVVFILILYLFFQKHCSFKFQ